jgi:hypothetical protein
MARPTAGGGQRHEDNLGSLAAHSQYPMAVLLAEIGDIGAGRLEDPQPEQAEHRNQREVAPAG